MLSIRSFDAPTFVSEVVPFLAEREVENDLLIGLAYRLCERSDGAQGALLSAVLEDGVTRGAALCTPPEFPVVSALPPGGAEALAKLYLEHGFEPAGAAGPGDHGRSLALAVAARHWGDAALLSDEVLYALTELIPPKAPPGFARRATEDDLPAVTRFIAGFLDEVVLPERPDPSVVAARSIALGKALLWDDDGPRALACHARSMLTGASIAPVYTPKDARRRGYGSAVTAALARDLLDAGHRFVSLHAERENQTSNHIYQALGFREHGAFAVWEVR